MIKIDSGTWRSTRRKRHLGFLRRPSPSYTEFTTSTSIVVGSSEYSVSTFSHLWIHCIHIQSCGFTASTVSTESTVSTFSHTRHKDDCSAKGHRIWLEN
jgi:hypothetical protein